MCSMLHFSRISKDQPDFICAFRVFCLSEWSAKEGRRGCVKGDWSVHITNSKGFMCSPKKGISSIGCFLAVGCFLAGQLPFLMACSAHANPCPRTADGCVTRHAMESGDRKGKRKFGRVWEEIWQLAWGKEQSVEKP